MLALVIVLAVVVVALVVFIVARERQSAAYEAEYTATAKDVQDARAQSVAISKGTTRGLAAEHLAPFFPEMVEQFAPGDWRFLGTPVDFVVFDGLGEEAVSRVVLVEVKSGRKGGLSTRQAALRAAVNAGAVRLQWLTIKGPKPAATRRPPIRPQIIELPHEET